MGAVYKLDDEQLEVLIADLRRHARRGMTYEDRTGVNLYRRYLAQLIFIVWADEHEPQQRQSGRGCEKRRAGAERPKRVTTELGLGDAVAWLISTATGGRIKTCGKCDKRRRWLNKHTPQIFKYPLAIQPGMTVTSDFIRGTNNVTK